MVKPASRAAAADSDSAASLDPWQRLSTDATGDEAVRRPLPVIVAAGCILLALILLAGFRQPLSALEPLQRALAPVSEAEPR